MSWRTVVVNRRAKLSFHQNALVVRDEEMKTVHLSEIQTLIIENNQATITMQLINELIKAKINVVICDERHLPQAQMAAFYGSYDTSRKVSEQIQWSQTTKANVWQQIIIHKIMNQAEVLHQQLKGEQAALETYLSQVESADHTNREAHAARVYWHSLFGKAFHREDDSQINAALDYGYTILLSCFAREIVSLGYVTQLGINHHNHANEFNLASDLMEPFRVLVDQIVCENKTKELTSDYKYKLINVLNQKIRIKGKEYYVNGGGISMYLKSVFDVLNGHAEEIIEFELVK